jgi:hypothetical protein
MKPHMQILAAKSQQQTYAIDINSALQHKHTKSQEASAEGTPCWQHSKPGVQEEKLNNGDAAAAAAKLHMCGTHPDTATGCCDCNSATKAVCC